MKLMLMLTRIFIALAIASLSAAMLQAQDSDEIKGRKRGKATNNIYIVQMAEAPAIAYTGNIPGFRATKPKKGQKIDPEDSAVVAYTSYLQNRHSDALNRAKGGRKVYDYTVVFNGFAAELTSEQAAALSGAEGVISVEKDELQHAETSSTPTFLQINAAGGLWEQVGGVGRAGEDIIIGVVDSGIWPENPSFSDREGNSLTGGKPVYKHIPGWKGKCNLGEEFPSSCNRKLIGARHYNAGFGGDAGLLEQRPWEFTSARDFNGHGTHTASTSGGNHNVRLPGALSTFGSTSGMAPRARISVYKGLWHDMSDGGSNGFTSDLVAAIDQAVADGVDVINYSISGTSTDFANSVQIAFLRAANAGIFVAAAAGNSGPTISTVNHPAPWLTTVAAASHDRNGEGSAVVDGVTYTGASYATPVSGQIIDAEDAGLQGANVAAARQCFAAADNLVNGTPTPVLDPAKIAGKIVLCDRGSNVLVNKSLAVKEAGGAGMVLTNVATSAPNTLALVHSVPTVHVLFTAANYAALHTAASAQPPKSATINQAQIVFNVPAPLTASFSSRGPSNAGVGDILKPDIAAPGVDILASVAPPGNGDQLFSSYQGTSMASPHIAGLAAVFKNLHPDWSPMMIKSALMTTGSDVLDTIPTNDPCRVNADTAACINLRQGGGHVKPNAAMNPGLVFDSNINDWLALLCGSTTAVTPATCTALGNAGFSFDRSDMNLASIAIGDLILAPQTVKRRVTNVGGSAATYNATVTGLAGVNAVVSPSSLTLDPGETKSFNVSFTRTSAPANAFVGGHLTWSDGTHNVRIPLVVRPVALQVPAEVFGTGAPINYNVGFGYSGPFTAAGRGLVPAETTAGSVADDPDDNFTITDTVGVTKIREVVIPAGTTFARFSLFDTHVSPASDIDLVVFRVNANGSRTQVAATGGATSNETANLLNPQAATYEVYAHGFAVPSGATANFTLFTWVLGSSSAGNMAVSAPTTAVQGTTAGITLTFSGLAPATKYLGSVAYSGSTGFPNPTIVRVDTQ